MSVNKPSSGRDHLTAAFPAAWFTVAAVSVITTAAVVVGVVSILMKVLG